MAQGQTRGQGAEAALSPEIVDALFDEAPFGLAIIDADMRYRRINERLATMHGLTAADHEGRRVQDLRPGTTGSGIERAVRDVLREGRVREGVRIEGPTAADAGGARQFVCSYLPLGDGVLAIVQDDTDPVPAERERSRLLRAAHAAQVRTATLQAVTEALNEALSPDEVAVRIVAETRRATGAVAGNVGLKRGRAPRGVSRGGSGGAPPGPGGPGRAGHPPGPRAQWRESWPSTRTTSCGCCTRWATRSRSGARRSRSRSTHRSARRSARSSWCCCARSRTASVTRMSPRSASRPARTCRCSMR